MKKTYTGIPNISRPLKKTNKMQTNIWRNFFVNAGHLERSNWTEKLDAKFGCKHPIRCILFEIFGDGEARNREGWWMVQIWAFSQPAILLLELHAWKSDHYNLRSLYIYTYMRLLKVAKMSWQMSYVQFLSIAISITLGVVPKETDWTKGKLIIWKKLFGST